ncbi:MAG: hypothetical protein WC449_06040 [Candidatus Paceibacterota bacterium]
MFKVLLVALMVICVSLVGCGQSKFIGGIEYKPIGVASKIVPKNLTTYSDSVRYEVCVGNVIWGVILCETVIAPIYFFGFSMFNPVGPMNSPAEQGETVKH